MNLSSISSGSKGNCILVKSKNASIMVDAGISKKRIEEGLTTFNTSPEKNEPIIIIINDNIPTFFRLSFIILPPNLNWCLYYTTNHLK